MNHHGLNFTLDSLYVDWEEVGTVIDHSDSGSTTGRLMLQHYLYKAAIALHATMTETGTGIATEQLPDYLQTLGYYSGGTRTDLEYYSLKSEICDRFPVLGEGYSHRVVNMVMGVPVFVNYAKGHEWVYDGGIIYFQERVWYDALHGLGSIYEHSESFFPHCNLGWYGNEDGYYYYGSVNTDDPHPALSFSFYSNRMKDCSTKSDYDTVGVEKYYRYYMKMISGIRSVNQ